MAFVTQVTENLDNSIVLKVRELIILLTGRPPRNATHIEELKYMLENFPHPNLDGVDYLQDHEDRSGTVPMDSDIWGKLADWRILTLAQQTETKEFLLMKFSIDDLKLAWDQYIIQNGGQVPTTIQYRTFINNWRGNKTKRRTQSLAQMMMALEQKEEDIYQERDYNSVLHAQTGLLTHLNGGHLQNLHHLQQEKETQFRHIQNLEREKETQFRHIQNLEQEKETQFRHIQNLEQEKETQFRHIQNLEQEKETQFSHIQNLKQEKETQFSHIQNLEQEKETQFSHIQNLEQENETQKAIIEEQNERLRKYKIDDRYLRKQLAKKDRINQELHDQLNDVNMLCNKTKKQLQTLLQK